MSKPDNAVPMPLRILHVVDSLEVGGLERVVTNLAIAQLQAGHQVAVFSINATNGFRSVLEAAGVAVHVGDKQGTLDLKVLRRLRALAVGLDVVHAHNFVPNYYAACALLGLRSAPVLTGTCHDMGARLSNRRLRWLYRWSLTRTARVAMVGRQVHDHFVGAGYVAPERAVTVLNGVPVGDFDYSSSQRQRARVNLGLQDELMVIGCVGRLVALKNHQILIRLMPGLLLRHPQVRLLIAGDGPLADELATLAAGLGVAAQVRFLGGVGDVAGLLPALDVFVQPSRTEGLSIALLEACAAGLPIVATRVGGNPEIVHDGLTGRLVPVDDADALCAVLDDLLTHPARRAELATAARDWVRNNASMAALRAAYDRFYLAALRK